MAYGNLRAEMARRHIKIRDIVDITGKSRSAVSANLKGCGEFSVSESIKIREKFFPDLSYEQLFSEVD